MPMLNIDEADVLTLEHFVTRRSIAVDPLSGYPLCAYCNEFQGVPHKADCLIPQVWALIRRMRQAVATHT